MKTEKKDFWDKLSALSAFLSTVVIALVGLWITQTFKERQNVRDMRLADERLRLERMELLEKFIPHLCGDRQHQNSAMFMIKSLGHDTLATKLAMLLERDSVIKSFVHINEIRNMNEPVILRNVEYAKASFAEQNQEESPGLDALAFALKELESGAREEGGENRGPWVIKYMQGKRGEGLPWAAGFVSWCFNQSPDGAPFGYTFNMDQMMASCEKRHWLIAKEDDYIPTPGDIMFVERQPGDATHVGIVEYATENYIVTIEGNSTDDGSSKGHKVARRIRSYNCKRFAHIPMNAD